MPTLPLYQVDAFTDRPFGGNPAAVCPLPGPIPDGLMQDIAAENNLSETAFFQRGSKPGESIGLRWFTPTVEVDICGHATLASAFVLMTELEPSRTSVTFQTRSGLLPVERRGGIYVMDFPAFSTDRAPDDTAAAVAAALRARPAEVRLGQVLLAVFEDAGAVRRLSPDMGALARFPTTVCVTAPGDGDPPGADFVSRYFAPGFGIPEDPVTGSSFCTLAPYWGARLGKAALRARQVSRRGGDVQCEQRGDRVLIGGEACLVLTGTLRY